MIRIRKGVGNNFTNILSDVLKVKSALVKLGYLDEEKVPNGYMTKKLHKSISVFQQDHGLTVDGFLLPNGITEATLNANLLSVGNIGIEKLPVSSDGIKRERLPPPPRRKIPGTEIPDEGVPEQGYPGSRKYKPHRSGPSEDIDPGIMLPYYRWLLMKRLNKREI